MNIQRCQLRPIARRFFRRKKVLFFARLLDGAWPKIDTKVEIDVEFVRANDFSKNESHYRLVGLRGKERFVRGHICVIARVRGQFAHIKWIAFNEAYVTELNRNIHVNSDSAYIYDAYTVPKFRGLRISPKITEESFKFLYAQKIRKAYAGVSHDNFSSLRAIHKVGYREIGAIQFTQLFKLKHYQFTRKS